MFALRYLKRGVALKNFIPLIKAKPVVTKALLYSSLAVTTFGMAKSVKMDTGLTQSTVTTDNHAQCAIIVLEINQSHLKEVLQALKQVPSIPKELNLETNEEDDLPPLMVGVGFSTKFWEHLTHKQQPHYETRKGNYGEMPHSIGNVVIHVKGQTYSLCFEAIQKALSKLPAGSYSVVQENYGFKYRDGRDLSGFLDGTMNPATPPQRESAAIIKETGGSYLIHQIWNHNLQYLNQVNQQQQEKWVGRIKPNSSEHKNLDAESHVARTRDQAGNRVLIVRQSMPFGTVSGTHGLLFIAYSNSVDKFNLMLDRMVGKGDGHNDSIMKFSKCVFGNYYYVPSLKELNAL